MDTNGSPVAETVVDTPAAPAPGYDKWIELKFDNVIYDSAMLARKNAIEAYYLGYLKAVDVIKKKTYAALFNWVQSRSEVPGCVNFTLTIFVSPPPSVGLFAARNKSLGIAAMADDGDGGDTGDGGGDDVDPPRPPMPPPPEI